MAKSDQKQIILQNGTARKEKPYDLNVWLREYIRLRKIRQTA